MSRTFDRLRRLEKKVGNEGQIFLVWYGSEQDGGKSLRKAIKDFGLTEPSQLWPLSAVACCRWKSHSPMPAPKWTTAEKMKDEELSFLIDGTRERLLASKFITQEFSDEIDTRLRNVDRVLLPGALSLSYSLKS